MSLGVHNRFKHKRPHHTPLFIPIPLSPFHAVPPYSVSLASMTASSSSLNLNRGIRGPNVSSRNTRLGGGGGRGAVGKGRKWGIWCVLRNIRLGDGGAERGRRETGGERGTGGVMFCGGGSRWERSLDG